MSNPKEAVPGDLIIDASDILDIVDVTAEEINSFVKFHDGYEKALANLERLKPEDIARAGLNPIAVQDAVALAAQHRKCEKLLPAAQKLAELIYETKMERAHRISLLIGEIVAQAKRRSQGSADAGGILGPLKDLLDYQLGPANKAVATKKKKSKEQEAADSEKEPASGGTP